MSRRSSEGAFKVGGRILAPYFVDRPEIQAALLRDARTGAQSNVLMAPRRFGKTALLRKVCSELSDERLSAYLNCLPLRRADAFHDRLVEAVLSAYEAQRGRARRLLARWKDVLSRPVISAFEHLEEIGGSLQSVGGIRLKFRTQEADAEDLIRAALAFPERFAEEQDLDVLLALDEFQALASLGEGFFSNVKASMDAQRRVVYLFSGSSLSVLREVFGREGKSPLYGMAGRVFLDELDEKRVARFVKRRLRTVHDVRISEDALAQFLERVGGIPYYVQKLGIALEQRLQLQGVESIGIGDVEAAFGRLLDEIDLDFQERWTTRFSEQQRAILLALAEGPATSSQIAARARTAPENLTYNLKHLVGTMILSKGDHVYRITDRVFAAWLARL